MPVRGPGECAMGVPRLSTMTRRAAESQQVILCSDRLWCQGACKQDADQCAEAEQLPCYSLLRKAHSLEAALACLQPAATFSGWPCLHILMLVQTYQLCA